MKNIFLVFSLSSVFVLSACDSNSLGFLSDKENKDTFLTKPVIDLTTPDRAIKSYWSLKDWVTDNEHQVILNAIQKNTEYVSKGVLPAVSTGKVNAFFSRSLEQQLSREKVNRKIETVNQETESRAIVVTRITNDDPIPQGIVLSEEDEKKRESGNIFKYLLEKDKDGWKVAEVTEIDPLLGESEKYRVPKPSAPIYVFSD